MKNDNSFTTFKTASSRFHFLFPFSFSSLSPLSPHHLLTSPPFFMSRTDVTTRLKSTSQSCHQNVPPPPLFTTERPKLSLKLGSFSPCVSSRMRHTSQQFSSKLLDKLEEEKERRCVIESILRGKSNSLSRGADTGYSYRVTRTAP